MECVNRDVTMGCTRLVKPRSVFSKPASLATPFWINTLPAWRWVTVGNPRSFRNTNASNICRPIRCTCGSVSLLPRAAYLWIQSSVQQFRSICNRTLFSLGHLVLWDLRYIECREKFFAQSANRNKRSYFNELS